MNTEKILTRLVQIAPEAINRITKPGQPHCVLATTVGQLVLAKLGIAAEPYPVEIHVCNQAWIDWADAKFAGGKAEQLRRGAYLLTNTPNWKGESFKSVTVDKPWDGHLVLRVPDGDNAWLVDLDMGAFNRPTYHVKLPTGMVAPLRQGRVAGTFTEGNTTTSVAYMPLEAPYRDDYQTSRDWVERDRFTAFVEKLAKVIKPSYPLRP